MDNNQRNWNSEPIRAGVVAITLNKRKVVGVGFFVSDKIILTCAHVVQAAKAGRGGSVWIQLLCNSNFVQAKVSDGFWRDADQEDVAILEVAESLQVPVQPLRIGPSENTEGQPFAVYGFPENVSGGMWGYGTINDSIYRNHLELKQLTSTEITNGFSGSPVFNQETQYVMGMVSERTRADLEESNRQTKQLVSTGRLTETAFATPSSVLAGLLPHLISFEPICPYLDLAAFTAKDSEFFFGRNSLVDELIDEIQKHPDFLAITGASGSGKSSVAQAKLLPKIQQGEVLGFSKDTTIVSFRPSQAKTSEAAFFTAFQEATNINSDEVITWDSIEQYIQSAHSRTVIFADQFEEIFGRGQHLEEDGSFLKELLNLLERNHQLTLILTMRTEFDPLLEASPLGRYLAKYKSFITRGVEGRHLNLEETIKGPAEKVGLRVDHSLVTSVIHDLEETDSPLPLLEFTLTEIWKKEGQFHNKLSYETYRSIGGVSGALLQWANRFYDFEPVTDSELRRRSESQKSILKKILGRLVQFGSNEVPDVRARVKLRDLEDLGEHGTVNILLNQMADARLLVKDEETAELVHDSLIKEWLQRGELGKWFEEQRQFLLWQQRFSQDVQEWEEDDTKLLRQPYLSTANQWLETHRDGLTHAEREYISKSQKKENQRQRKLIGGLITGIVILSISLVFALIQRNIAVDREKVAKSIQQATIAEANLNTDTTKSLAVALSAVQTKNTPEAQLALGKAFYANHEIAYFEHPNEIKYGEYSADDSDHFLTLANDGIVRIWNSLDSENPVCLIEGEGLYANDARFHPQDGNKVLVGSNNSQVSLWDIVTCQPIQSFEQHTAPIRSVSFSAVNPDLMIVASSDGTASIWNVNTPSKPVHVLEEHTQEVWKAVFHPLKLNRVLTVSDDNTVKVWNLGDQTKSITIKPSRGHIVDASFDPTDPDRVMTVSNDRTAQIWNVKNIEQPINLDAHESPVKFGVINPQNPNQAVTVTQEGSVKLWNLNHPEQPQTLFSGIIKASHASFNPHEDDQVLITGHDGSVGRAEVWNISGEPSVQHELLGHKGEVFSGMFKSENDQLILTVGDDNTARLWNVRSKAFFRTTRADQGIVIAADFTGEQSGSVIFLNKDGLVQHWDTSSHTLLNSFKLNTSLDSILSADFNPNDYREVAAINSRGEIHIWNLDSPDESTRIPLVNDKALSVSYSPKSPDHLMVVTQSGVVTIHSISSPHEDPIVLSKLPNRIIYGQFNPHDENKVATANGDGTISIWDLRNINRPETERRQGDDLFWFVSHHLLDPNIVFAGGQNRRVWVWDLSQEKPPIELEGHMGIVTFGSMSYQRKSKVVTAARDGLVNIWDLDYVNEPLSISEYGEEFTIATFNPHSPEQILTLTNSGILGLYNISGRQLIDRAHKSLSRCAIFLEQIVPPTELTDEFC